MEFRSLSAVLFSLGFLLAACGEKEKEPPVVVVPANKAPVAKVSGPKSVNPGTEVTLDASDSVDPDGKKIKFLWSEGADNPPNNFLNGVDLTASKITFTPDAAGTFEYSVRVKDASGETDTATISVVVKSGTVGGGTNHSPVATSLTINGITYSLPGAPTVFTTATGKLDISIQGTDADEAANLLTQEFSANVTEAASGPGKRYSVAYEYNAAEDDDGFGVASVTAKLKDSDGASAGPYTVHVRIVPAAKADLTPKAVFVDCGAGVDGTGLTMDSPRNTLQAGYDTAVAGSIQDVWVGLGTCAGAQVDFTGVHLWGLFDMADLWRRRTEWSDKAIDKLAGPGHKHSPATRIQDGLAQRLIFTSGAGSATGSLKLDGFAFDLTGANLFAVSMTTPSSDSVRIDIVNSEFVGAVTSVGSLVASTWIPGGILIQRGASSTGSTYLLRNFFAVAGAGGSSHMQTWIDLAVRNSNNGHQTYFYSNVFTGTVSATPYYKCNNYTTSALKNPFAFCLYAYDQAPFVGRNTFWASATTSYSGITPINPVIVSSGMGKMRAYGNLVFATREDYRITAFHGSDDGSAGTVVDGTYVFNAYPVTSTSGRLFVTNRSNGRTDTPTAYSATGYMCLSGTSFGNGPPGSCTGSVAGQISNGSIEYFPPDLTIPMPPAQRWRVQGTVIKDLFTETDVTAFMPAEARWDFDGVYGPIDNTSSGTPKFNAGAFEALP